MEDFMQPSLFDEVAMIMNSKELPNLVYLIKSAQEPLTNWYTEKEQFVIQPSVDPSPKSTLVQLESNSIESSPESDVTFEDNFLSLNNNTPTFDYLVCQSSQVHSCKNKEK